MTREATLVPVQHESRFLIEIGGSQTVPWLVIAQYDVATYAIKTYTNPT